MTSPRFQALIAGPVDACRIDRCREVDPSSSKSIRINEGPAFSSGSLNSFVPKDIIRAATAPRAERNPSDSLYRTANPSWTYVFSDKLEGAAYLNLAHPNAAGIFFPIRRGAQIPFRGSCLSRKSYRSISDGMRVGMASHAEFDDQQLELELDRSSRRMSAGSR